MSLEHKIQVQFNHKELVTVTLVLPGSRWFYIYLDKGTFVPILTLSNTMSIILDKCVRYPELAGHNCTP